MPVASIAAINSDKISKKKEKTKKTEKEEAKSRSETKKKKTTGETEEEKKVIDLSKAMYLSELAAKIRKEPSESTPDTITLTLVLPNNEAVSRMFYKKQALEEVLSFCQVQLNTTDRLKILLSDSAVADLKLNLKEQLGNLLENNDLLLINIDN